MGKGVVAFWISTSCGFVALILLLSGTCRYRHFKPSGNPISRFSQVIVASMRKLELEVPSLEKGYMKFMEGMRKMSYKRKPKPPSELQRMGIGLAIGIVAMIIAALVEQHRLRLANEGAKETSSLSILWQTPQYVLVGVAEAFMYVAQWEFFAAQIPDGLKSLGLGLSMSSAAMGSYLCSMILTVVMKITSNNGKPGWITPNLNDGHMDRFFFLSAALTALNLGFFIFCAKRYNCIVVEKRDGGTRMEEA
ncbi:unnamed protein product [Ilex paraguariensis]|uniref:Uncharacterized protein n=1 Tax=Ilex paraguariensis TaxID=185542 RepID=A0ABC8RW68_9AQUA